VRHFQILIVSAVKICKQCLQSALAPYRGFAPRHHWGLPFPHPWVAYSPLDELPGAITVYDRNLMHTFVNGLPSIGKQSYYLIFAFYANSRQSMINHPDISLTALYL